MYKKQRWLAKRKFILKRDRYLCQSCLRYGKQTDAVLVHHLIPYGNNPQLAFENTNLISLCNHCHEKCHNRNSDELTEFGKELLKAKTKKVINTSPPDFNKN